MKKKFVIFLLVIVILITVIVMIFKNNKENVEKSLENKYINDTKNYKNVDVNKIKSIEIKKNNDNPIMIADKTMIYQLYENLGQIHIEKEIEEKISNKKSTFTIIMNDGEKINYIFYDENIKINNKLYKIDGLSNINLE